MAVDPIDLDNALGEIVKAHHNFCEAFRNYTLQGSGDTDNIIPVGLAGGLTWQGIHATRDILNQCGIPTENANNQMEKHSQWSDATIVSIVARRNTN